MCVHRTSKNLTLHIYNGTANFISGYVSNSTAHEVHHNIVDVVNISFRATDPTASRNQSTIKLPPMPPIDNSTLEGYGRHTHTQIGDFIFVVLYLVSYTLIDSFGGHFG